MTKKVFVLQEGSYWQTIESGVQNCVVQVCAQIGEFNWREPYLVTDQYENRGSGFFIDANGFFVTNAHVVEYAKHVWVHIPLLGQMLLHSHVIGVCPDRDLALLCLSEKSIATVRQLLGHIPFVTFGDSDTVRRTESVMAMGYPLGQSTLKSTTGVVSGRETGQGYSLIQITAPINEGSSGGPLLNFKGEVIGITVAVVPEAQNIGYIIPINELRIILSDLYSHRLVHKPFFGARFINSSDEKAVLLNNPKPSGLYVGTVFSGSLLDNLGVKMGDMIYSFNGLSLDEYGEILVSWAPDKIPLFDIVSRLKIGDPIEMVIYRNGERKEIAGFLELYNPFAVRKRFPDYEDIAYEIIGGMVLMELADNHLPELLIDAPSLAQFGIAENKVEPVLVITHILPGSYVQQTRILQVGDLIEKVNGIIVTTVEEFRAQVLSGGKNGILTFTTKRDIIVALSVEIIIAQEEELSQAFAFPLSGMVKKLMMQEKK